MSITAWLRPPRQLVTLFLLAALASTAALGWLAWRLLASDRIEAAQQLHDARERAADTSALAFDRALSTLDNGLDSDAEAGSLLPGAVLVRFGQGEFVVSPPNGLPYFPGGTDAQPVPPTRFKDAERLEISGELDAAAIAYETLRASGDPRTRALALTRLARIRRKQGAWASALGAYKEVERMGNVGVEGFPAALVAHLGRASIFETGQPDADRLRAEATQLQDAISRGEIHLTRGQHSLCAEAIRRWGGTNIGPDVDASSRAEAFEQFWSRRSEPTMAPRGRRLIPAGSRTVLIGWRLDRDRSAGSALILDPSAIRGLAAAAVPVSFGWALTNLDGELIAGTPPPARDASIRAGSAAGRPWTVHVFPSSATTAGVASSRRAYLLAVLLSVVGILAVAWFFIWRGIAREARVSRLQSDFVAAVSHEFRSPLTSLRHIADLLATERMPSAEHRQRAYALLLSETDRLGRLVEGLLDFGRLQDGRATFKFEPVNLPELAEDVIADFSRRLDPGGHRVELSTELQSATASADRDALTRVLWNLLDNAVKYSPDRTPVQVVIKNDSTGGRFLVSVSDSGLGIPETEQTRIFDRFVRGADAKARRITGTGIGLSMAREIMRAHAGDITVTSTPGRGSTFTMVVPIAHA